MEDRAHFEAYVRTWLWSVNGNLDRLGWRYSHPAIQLAYQCWLESRRSGFVSTGPLDIELP